MCSVMAAIQGISAVASFAQQAQATNQYNQQTAEAHRDASLAGQRKYEGEQRNFLASTKEALDKGYEATMRSRESIAAARASSTFGGVTMKNILSAERQKAAFNANKVSNYISDSREAYKSNVKGYEAEAQGRINATPFKAAPSPLNLMIDLATIGVKTINKDPTPYNVQ